MTGATYCLEALAAVAQARGDVEDAARLFGAARSTRRRLAVPEWTASADAAEPVVVRVRRSFPTDRFDQLWQEGAACDPFVTLQRVLDGDAAPAPHT